MKWRSELRILYDCRILTKFKGNFFSIAIKPDMLYALNVGLFRSNIFINECKRMRILRWICGNAMNDMIHNVEVLLQIGVTFIDEKMSESCLRWFVHV